MNAKFSCLNWFAVSEVLDVYDRTYLIFASVLIPT